MNITEQIKLIKQARELVAKANACNELPQLSAILRSADMELHWALWNLGVPVPLTPDTA